MHAPCCPRTFGKCSTTKFVVTENARGGASSSCGAGCVELCIHFFICVCCDSICSVYLLVFVVVMYLHEMLSDNPSRALARAALANHVRVKAMQSRDLRMSALADGDAKSSSKKKGAKSSRRMVKRLFVYGNTRMTSRLALGPELLPVTEAPSRVRKARDEPESDTTDARKRSKVDEDDAKQARKTKYDRVEAVVAELPHSTYEEKQQHLVRIYAPLPGTLLYKYSKFVQEFGGPIEDVRVKDGKLFAHVERDTDMAQVAIEAAVRRLTRRPVASSSESDTESDSDSDSVFDDGDVSTTSMSSAASVSSCEDSKEPRVRGGKFFAVEAALEAFPTLCITEPSDEIPFYVPYLSGLEYAELECLLERMERLMPRMMSYSDAMTHDMARTLLGFVRAASMIRFHGYDASNKTEDDPWVPSGTCRVQLDRVKRFVWSRDIRCLQEVLLELPRLLLLRSQLSSVVHRRLESKSTGDAATSEWTVYHSADYIPYPGADPLAVFLRKIGRGPGVVMSVNAAKQQRPLGTFLLEADCTALMDMGFAGMDKRVLILATPEDILRVFLCRSERMMAHIQWLRTKSEEALMFRTLHRSRVFVLDSNNSRVYQRRPETFDLRELLQNATIPTEVYWGTVLTHDTSLSRTVAGPAFGKLFCLYDAVFPEVGMLTSWDWIRFTTKLCQQNNQRFQRACAGVCEGYLDGVYSLDELDKMVLRHVMRSSDMGERASVFVARVVLQSFEENNPDWATPPHFMYNGTRDPLLWWIEDVYLAKLLSVSPLSQAAVKTIHALYCHWVEPPTTTPHVCMGYVDYVSGQCKCREKLGLLVSWASGTTVNVLPLLASQSEHDEIENFFAAEEAEMDEEEPPFLVNMAQLTEDQAM